MSPSGASARICSMGAVQGRTTEKTLNSRMRRAMSWVYCDPKSRMTIVEVSTNPIVNVGSNSGPDTLVGILVARALNAGDDADAEKDDGGGNDVGLRDVNQMGEIGDSG